MRCPSTDAKRPFDYRSAHPLRTLYRLLDVRWYAVAATMVLFLVKNSPVWLWPVTISAVIFTLETQLDTPDQALSSLILYGGIMAGALAVNIPGHMWYIAIMSRRFRAMELTLRDRLLRRLQQLSISFHDQTESGRLHTKVMRDVEQVQVLGNYMGQNALEGLINLMVALGIALVRDPVVALFYLVATPLAVGMIKLFRKRMQVQNRDFRKSMENVGSRVSEMIDMIPMTRAHGLEHQEVDSVTGKLRGVFYRGRRLDDTNALFQSSMFVVMHLMLLTALLSFAWLAVSRSMNIADVVLYLTLFGQMVASVMTLLNIYPQMAKGVESMVSLGEILEAPDLEINEGKPAVAPVRGAITFDQVSFRYDSRDQQAIDNLSLDVRAGECVAFVGSSGSGKSTCMNLLIGFYRPQGGRLLLDGQDMAELDLRTFRQQIAVVPQQVLLFAGTLRDNICFGMDQVAEADLQAAIDAANLRDAVDALPDGLDTEIGEQGVQLSGGQRQRVAIARAIIRDPRVIILDEATSALDVVSERKVQEAIERLIKGRTTFIVAHRLSTIRQANRIVVLEHGRMVECGPPAELEAAGGPFARLKALQS